MPCPRRLRAVETRCQLTSRAVTASAIQARGSRQRVRIERRAQRRRVSPLPESGTAERQLAVHQGRARAVGRDLGIVVEHPGVGGVPVAPLLGEVRRRSPGHLDERLVDVQDRTSRRRADQQVPVLGHAARQRLVHEADAVEQSRAPDEERRRVQHGHPRADQRDMVDAITSGQPHGALTAVVDRHRGRDELRLRCGLERGHLGLELAGQPEVVVVAERDQWRRRGEDAGVAASRQPRGAVVLEHPDRPSGHVLLEGHVGVCAVEHDEDIERAGVLLVEHRLHGAAYQLGAVVRGHDDRDRRMARILCSTHSTDCLRFGHVVCSRPERS